MKKNLIIYSAFIGLISLLASCERDDTKVIMLANPIAPTIESMPTLTLSRANGTAILTFVGTPVDPGFNASANYFLEACVTGNEFADSVTIWSGVQDTLINMITSDLNSLLLKKFPADQTTSADFRIRSVLVLDAGTGAPGTGSNPLVYTSSITTTNVSPYGLPRLDLINSGTTQKIESALGDGNYTGFVKLDAAKPFTFRDPDASINYGADGAALAVNGDAISVATSGWYKLSVSTTGLTYTVESYMIGLVGSATPNGWNTPDQKMDYNSAAGTWEITVDLVDGEFKFRLNDGWAWNLGGTTDNLVHNGSNCAITAGNYTIKLTITVALPVGSEAGTYTIKKNN